jgi:hypothetical protein
MVKGSSVVKVQVFDERKLKRRDQGFLGFVEIRVTDYLDLEFGGQGMFSGFRIASPLQLPTNGSLTETILLDLKGTDENMVVQGKLRYHLSTNFTMSATSSRPTDSSLALTSLPSYDSNRSVNNASVNNFSVNNASVNNVSVNNFSVNNYSVNNVSVYTASVNSASVSAQHSFNPNEDQYGPLPEGWESGIDTLSLTYYVNHHTRSITRNRPSPNQAVNHHTQEGETNAARDEHSPRTPVDDLLEASSDGPNTQRSGIAGAQSGNAAVVGAGGGTTTAGSGSLPAGWEERYRPEGRSYSVDHNTRTNTWVDPRRHNTIHVMGSNGQSTSLQQPFTSSRSSLASLGFPPSRAFPPLPNPVNPTRNPASYAITRPVRSPHNKDTREREKNRRSVPTAVSILNALNIQFSPPPPNLDASRPIRDDDTVVYAPSEDSIREEKKERGGFWSWATTGDRDSHRREARDKEDGQRDLMRMIGIYTALPCYLSLFLILFT